MNCWQVFAASPWNFTRSKKPVRGCEGNVREMWNRAELRGLRRWSPDPRMAALWYPHVRKSGNVGAAWPGALRLQHPHGATGVVGESVENKP